MHNDLSDPSAKHKDQSAAPAPHRKFLISSVTGVYEDELLAALGFTDAATAGPRLFHRLHALHPELRPGDVRAALHQARPAIDAFLDQIEERLTWFAPRGAYRRRRRRAPAGAACPPRAAAAVPPAIRIAAE